MMTEPKKLSDAGLMPLLLEGIQAHRELGADAANQWYADLSPEDQARVKRDADALANDWLDVLNSLPVKILLDCKKAGMDQQQAAEYCAVILTYLGMSLSNFAGRMSSLCSWENQNGKVRYTFSRQAISMVWDYAEINPFGSSGFMRVVEQMAAALERMPANQKPGVVLQQAAQDSWSWHGDEEHDRTEEAE